MRKSTKDDWAAGGVAVLLAIGLAVGIDAGFNLLAKLDAGGRALMMMIAFGLLALRTVLGLLAAIFR